MIASRFKSWLAGAILLLAITGSTTLSHDTRCTADWESAGERSRGYLADRVATPYLAMMFATHYEPPADHRISGPDFIAACRVGAIWRIAPDVAN